MTPHKRQYCAVVCLWCGKTTTRLLHSERERIRHGSLGPFCSPRCWATFRDATGRRSPNYRDVQFKATPPDHHCLHCGRTFRGMAVQKYCSVTCYNAVRCRKPTTEAAPVITGFAAALAEAQEKPI